MIFFTLDDVEYAARIITEAEFEADYYDDAILNGAGFAAPDGTRYVVLAPVPADQAQQA